MGAYDNFEQANINKGLQKYRNTRGAVLIDLRSPEEYRQGHVPDSKNIPLSQLDKITSLIKDKERQVFVYCHSGSQSRQAISQLQHMGYTNVTNLGGIVSYRGKLER